MNLIAKKTMNHMADLNLLAVLGEWLRGVSRAGRRPSLGFPGPARAGRLAPAANFWGVLKPYKSIS